MTTSKTNILVVDDDLSFCRMMERMLLDNQYACTSVTSSEDALDALQRERFDLLMSDIYMPGMDGLQLIERVREQFPQIAILVTSGVNKHEVAHRALELGAYGYMLKPCDEFEVLIHVSNALRRLELERANQAYQQGLELLIEERTAELETANLSLGEVNLALRQQGKLAAIGLLAAGIAHEIKTPTGFVASNLGSLSKYQQRMIEYITELQALIDRSGLPKQKNERKSLARKLKIDMILDDVVDLVDDCLNGTDRIQKIIQGLKDFSRQGQEQEEDLDLNQVLEDSLMLVRNELKYKADVQVEKCELPKLRGCRQRLAQVFINLLVNASHAIKGKGIIKVSTLVEGREIIARVADNGCGIPAENLDKIFQPFYTTKEIGVGTGLGLSIIKDIVEEHQGRIEVESTLGEGTVFTVRFLSSSN